MIVFIQYLNFNDLFVVQFNIFRSIIATSIKTNGKIEKIRDILEIFVASLDIDWIRGDKAPECKAIQFGKGFVIE